MSSNGQLAIALKHKARQLGFTLAGITLPQRTVHFDVYQGWIEAGRQAEMSYLAEQKAIERRANPGLILPECRSILVLGVPYNDPRSLVISEDEKPRGRVAAYAWGVDYHLVLPARLQALVVFLEEQVGRAVPSRWYTDTGPVMERELAMRAGLGWIGKNTCLINPQHGSYFLISEIFLGIDLPGDQPYTRDQCGSCTRCLQACPTKCIRPDRTLDAGRCISYLTIENKAIIPDELRARCSEWVFGCDICQMVCPWNIRFAEPFGDLAFVPQIQSSGPVLTEELLFSPQEFNRKYLDSPLKRAKRRGYLRNVAIAAGNSGRLEILPALETAMEDEEELVREAAEWAIQRILIRQERE